MPYPARALVRPETREPRGAVPGDTKALSAKMDRHKNSSSHKSQMIVKKRGNQGEDIKSKINNK